ncbi:MAG TPA: ADP-ribosylation factor-like protein [Candidatus Lokiarchaeia archaeon]|nr:ADP-ribosylation factor-like protein [Candidatus Lokiarchaeia archaeon]
MVQIPMVKISLVGNGRVGKSTIRNMLEGNGITKTKPTVGVDVGRYSDDELKCAVFDLGGQDRFKCLWDDFIKGSSLVMVVTDSSRDDVEKSKDTVKSLQTKLQGSKIIAIANKQDEANKLNAMQVEKILGVKTYPMIATESTRRNAMISIVKENLSV